MLREGFEFEKQALGFLPRFALPDGFLEAGEEDEASFGAGGMFRGGRGACEGVVFGVDGGEG